MILSKIYKYQKPIVLYGYINDIYHLIDIENKKLFTSYSDIDYNYYPIIQSNEYIRPIKKGIILSKYKYDKYLSIYISGTYKSIAKEYLKDILSKNIKEYYFGLDINDIFYTVLYNLDKIFSNEEYIYAYEQILKLYFISKEYYFNHENIIYLLSCMLIKKQVELIDIDPLYIL